MRDPSVCTVCGRRAETTGRDKNGVEVSACDIPSHASIIVQKDKPNGS